MFHGSGQPPPAWCLEKGSSLNHDKFTFTTVQMLASFRGPVSMMETIESHECRVSKHLLTLLSGSALRSRPHRPAMPGGVPLKQCADPDRGNPRRGDEKAFLVSGSWAILGYCYNRCVTCNMTYMPRSGLCQASSLSS